MRLVAAAALLVLAPVAASRAQPAVKPLRDVDVTYKVPVGNGTVLLQRLRFSAGLHRQRVDLPTSGNWMVLDFSTHRMDMVRDQSKEIVDLPAPDTAAAPQSASSFTRVGEATVAGLPCTEWRTRDIRGLETVACYTQDGVLLRAKNDAGATMMEALTVRFGTVQPAVFALPDGYSKEVR